MYYLIRINEYQSTEKKKVVLPIVQVLHALHLDNAPLEKEVDEEASDWEKEIDL